MRVHTGMDLEYREHSYIASGTENLYCCYGNQCKSSSKKGGELIYLKIQLYLFWAYAEMTVHQIPETVVHLFHCCVVHNNQKIKKKSLGVFKGWIEKEHSDFCDLFTQWNITQALEKNKIMNSME